MPLLNPAEISGMRQDVANTQLDHLCTIERRTQGGTNPDGHPVWTWTTVFANLPCHYYQRNEVEFEGEENATKITDRIVVAAPITLTTQDRVASVTGYDGLVIGGPFNIIEVLDRHADSVIVCERIR